MQNPVVKALIKRTMKLNRPLNHFCEESGLSYSLITKIMYGLRPNPTLRTIDKWETALKRAERPRRKAAAIST